MYDNLRHPIARALCVTAAVFFACTALMTFLATVPASRGEWWTPSLGDYLQEYAPLISLATGVLLFAYGSAYAVTAFQHRRAHTTPARQH